MKFATLLSALILAGIGISAVTASGHRTKPEPKGFVVLELFTSEGCSSCPPAEDLMAKIQSEYNGLPVYLLSFHVDYWDKDGWKDVFSNVDYSNRQIEYGNWLRTTSIYTPQLVVNGMSEYFGADESKIRKAISKSLTMEPVTKLAIQGKQAGNKLVLQYQVSQGSRYSRLLVATIQKTAQNKVERGENKGRLLSHVQIVRNLHSESLSAGTGTTSISLPKGFNKRDWEVIAMIQDVNKGGIATAARVSL